MRVSRAQADENRERILDTATRLFRERGIDGIGVADLMKSAGLTHGGFYGHFKSKDDLVAQACGRAMARMRENWARVIDQASGDPLDTMADHYLSSRHRENVGRGCLMAALGSEVARQDDAVPDGVVFIPFAYVEAAANLLTNPKLDPFGKIPEFKFCAAKVEAVDPATRVAAE